jgi:hypothetical protein
MCPVQCPIRVFLTKTRNMLSTAIEVLVKNTQLMTVKARAEAQAGVQIEQVE